MKESRSSLSQASGPRISRALQVPRRKHFPEWFQHTVHSLLIHWVGGKNHLISILEEELGRDRRLRPASCGGHAAATSAWEALHSRL